jgi:aromatic amino acid aminotransferase I / 2-aminoadipate transaminase
MTHHTTNGSDNGELAEPKSLTHHFSDAANNIVPSPLKALYKYTGDPTKISLASGLPPAEYFPFSSVQATVHDPNKFSEDLARVGEDFSFRVPLNSKDAGLDIPLELSLQYSASQGLPPLVDFLTEHTRMVHTPPYKNWDVVCTLGNTHAWDSVLTLFCNPGDTILVEKYCYPPPFVSANGKGYNVVPVFLDMDGIVPEKLEILLANWQQSQGKFPRLLYTICTGQNPTGSSLSEERRRAIYQICQKYDLLIIEDEPYYFLQMDPYEKEVEKRSQHCSLQSYEHFLNSLIPSFLKMDVDGRVLRMDSLSKVIAPGVRVGWIVGQKVFLEKVIRLNEYVIQAPNGFSQSLLYGLFSRWGQTGYLDWLINLRKEYTIRRDFAIDMIEKYIDKEYASWDAPVAGMFFHIEIDASKHPKYEELGKDALAIEKLIFDRSLENGTVIVPGSWFQVDKSMTSEKIFFRGTYAAVALKNLEQGMKQFAEALRAEFSDN